MYRTPRIAHRIILAVALPFLAFGVGPAGATATLTCEAADRNVEFSLQDNVGRGAGAVVQITSGDVKVKAVRGKTDEATFTVKSAHLIQQWLFDKELRLGVQTAEKNDATVYLAIIARQVKGNDEGDRYRVRYVLKLQGPKGTLELRGRIKDCEAG